jgi:hypothetical protein
VIFFILFFLLAMYRSESADVPASLTQKEDASGQAHVFF